MVKVRFDCDIPRQRMVKEQLVPRGITDPDVLRAMGAVPRHLFVPEALAPTAYDDRPLPIGHGQTISQPVVVAVMSQLLQAKPGMSVLEVGTGSGYQAAVLQAMGLTVFTVERLQPLYRNARQIFSDLGLRGIRTLLTDGTMGWPEMAPFDRIMVTAGGPGIPETLSDQLTDPGIMVIPIGQNRGKQVLVQLAKIDGKISSRNCSQVSFVDLVGCYGWQDGKLSDEYRLRGL